MELGADAARKCALTLVGRPKLRIGVCLCKVLEDREGVVKGGGGIELPDE